VVAGLGCGSARRTSVPGIQHRITGDGERKRSASSWVRTSGPGFWGTKWEVAFALFLAVFAWRGKVRNMKEAYVIATPTTSLNQFNFVK
jgi:hypothetical protein